MCYYTTPRLQVVSTALGRLTPWMALAVRVSSRSRITNDETRPLRATRRAARAGRVRDHHGVISPGGARRHTALLPASVTRSADSVTVTVPSSLAGRRRCR
jgi:hypothetical protein